MTRLILPRVVNRYREFPATHLDDLLITPHVVYIGRPSIWGNPYQIGKHGTREECVARYREYILGKPNLLAALPSLSGNLLVCFCAPKACHGDVLVELFRERCL